MNRNLLLKELQRDSPSEIQNTLSIKCRPKAIFNLHGNLSFFCDFEGGVTVWNVKCRRIEKRLLLPDSQFTNQVGANEEKIFDIDLPAPKSGSVIVVAYKHKILLVDVTSEEIRCTVTFPLTVTSIVCHPIEPNGIVVVQENKEPVMMVLHDGVYSCENDINSNGRWQWKPAIMQSNNIFSTDSSNVSYVGICSANELSQCPNGYLPHELTEAEGSTVRPSFAVAFLSNGLVLRSGPTGFLKVFQVEIASTMANSVPKCLVWLSTGLKGSPRLAVSCLNGVVGAFAAKTVVLFRHGFFDEIVSDEMQEQYNQAEFPAKYTQSELSHEKHMVMRYPDRQNYQKISNPDMCLSFSGDGNSCYGLYSNNLESRLFCWDMKSREKDFDSRPRSIMNFVSAHSSRPEFLTIDINGLVYWWKHAFVEHWPAFCYNFKPQLTCSIYGTVTQNEQDETDAINSGHLNLSASNTTNLQELDVFYREIENSNTSALNIASVPFFLPCRPQ